MQEVRLWEVVNDDSLEEVKPKKIAFEERLENWLAKDISVLDSSLLVIGRQVRPHRLWKVHRPAVPGQCWRYRGNRIKERPNAKGYSYARHWNTHHGSKTFPTKELRKLPDKYLRRQVLVPWQKPLKQSFETNLPRRTQPGASHLDCGRNPSTPAPTADRSISG